MKLLRKIPIKGKLTLLTMLTSSVALVLTALAFVGFEALDFRSLLVEEIATTAQMTGNLSALAILIGDRASAEQTLQALAAHEPITAAALYDGQGRLFASYQKAGSAGHFSAPPVEHESHRFGADSVMLFREINLAGTRIGTVYICHHLKELSARLRRYIGIVVAAMAASSSAAYLLSTKLQKLISRPISHLSFVAGSVAAGEDYSLRALKEHEDELGTLVDDFNEMLSRIQQRDCALEAARQDLEKRVEERTRELAHSLSLLSATLDSTADGILAIAFSGSVVCSNSQFARMWGIPDEELAACGDAQTIALSAERMRDPEAFIRRINELHGDPDSEAFDVLELKDGRIFERYIKPQRVGGKTVGLVINFRDITGRKEAELELARIHEELVEASRRAGMAEMATTVLHNIGNVLNSVNISCTVAVDKVRHSRVASVERTANLLEKHSSDLAAFFCADPAGRKLPAYLGKLSARLLEERAAVLEELALLGQNIEHIKSIVSAQQSYAKDRRGVLETLPIESLITAALQMNGGGLMPHPVEIISERAGLPAFPLDKHKVLQILVNLVRNASQAMSGRPDSRLLIRISGGADRVRVSFQDNGCGIPLENLRRIFAHGFTTKKDGHGFGLHSGVLAARQMGGSLSVQSEGPGKGATFTLELPAAPQERGQGAASSPDEADAGAPPAP